MPILNYTTKVAANKTVGQVHALLAFKGATDVMVTYRDGRPAILTSVPGQPSAIDHQPKRIRRLLR